MGCQKNPPPMRKYACKYSWAILIWLKRVSRPSWDQGGCRPRIPPGITNHTFYADLTAASGRAVSSPIIQFFHIGNHVSDTSPPESPPYTTNTLPPRRKCEWQSNWAMPIWLKLVSRPSWDQSGWWPGIPPGISNHVFLPRFK